MDRLASQFIKDFIRNYNEDGDLGYFHDVADQYPEELYELHNNYPLLTQRMKIGNAEKLLAKFYDKKEYVTHVRNLKQSLNHWLVF